MKEHAITAWAVGTFENRVDWTKMQERCCYGSNRAAMQKGKWKRRERGAKNPSGQTEKTQKGNGNARKPPKDNTNKGR